MYKYYFILSKLLKLNYKTLKSIVNLSIIISTFICVVLIPVSLSVINGFEENIKSKIISFDGYARVYSDELNIETYNYIENIPSIVKFHEQNGLIKTSQGSEAVTILSYLNSYNLQDFSLYSTIDIKTKNNSGIFIGQSLYDKLFSSDLESLEKRAILINTDNTIVDLEVLGVFQTHVPLYDKHFVLSTMQSPSTTGFIADRNIYDSLDPNIKGFFYIYKDRYYEFLKWLDSYDLPIFLLLSSIVFIAIVNNIFCFNIDLLNRKNDSYIFNLLGLSSKQIHFIYFCKYLLLNFSGIFFGSIGAIILIFMQLNYDLIKIPNEIYFSSSIPLSLKIEYFLYMPVIFLFQSLCLFIKNRKSFSAL